MNRSPLTRKTDPSIQTQANPPSTTSSQTASRPQRTDRVEPTTFAMMTGVVRVVTKRVLAIMRVVNA